ncbi:YrbI family 3-deoxy-D-manno-octulosonate 8-phosphate phosphatase [Catalinimonas alkaloidigena]|uniref:KdsC family phosphatase n=1 Tax=Catalinimonas alkaloidigena TaxID=1075417 RepID=UPI0024057C30|nr:HAD-IIIA family hydrolase [Catalinimonas alkaloidigena]MDF9795744.1 YrbI family 3-deoxy-D-manno-octulosonate 8-phosphate phosphatase [Catalinimonas alkaloidigena]
MFLELRHIKLIVLDIDGTLTDGGVYITENGDEFKKYNTKDGMAIKRLIKKGIHIAFLSASSSLRTVTKRAEMLGVKYCYVGNHPKTEVLHSWLEELKLELSQVLFMGDDINDLEIMRKVGVSACPADAVPHIREEAKIVLSRKGGDACFRELVDLYFPLLD